MLDVATNTHWIVTHLLKLGALCSAAALESFGGAMFWMAGDCTQFVSLICQLEQ
jgi:hypothetical protein